MQEWNLQTIKYFNLKLKFQFETVNIMVTFTLTALLLENLFFLICKFYSSNLQQPWPGYSAPTAPNPHSLPGWTVFKENNKRCKMESFYFRKKQQITQVTFSKCNPNGNCTHILDFRNERLTYLRTIYLEYTKKEYRINIKMATREESKSLKTISREQMSGK